MTAPRVNVVLVVKDHVWREVGEIEAEIVALSAKLAERQDELAMHLAIAAAAKVERPEP